MIKISFFAGELFFALVWLSLRMAVWLRRRRIDWRREAALLLMYVNAAVIIRYVFYPFFPVDGRIQPLLFDAAAVWPFRVNLTPLVHILRFRTKKDLLINLLGNVALFIPSGIILPLLYKRLDCFWKVVLAGAGISLAIEVIQLPFSVRATDIDDLILNTLGVAIGYGLFAAVGRIKRNRC